MRSFLKIAGVRGESTDDKHKEWIDLVSCRWEQRKARDTVGGQQLVIVKKFGWSSQVLMQKMMSGEHISEAILETEANGNVLLKLSLRDIVISAGRTSPGTDEFSLDCAYCSQVP